MSSELEDNLKKILRKNVRYMRNNVPLEELGEMIGTTSSRLSQLETGRHMPKVELLYRLSKVFGITIDQLLDAELRKKSVKTLVRREPTIKMKTEAHANGKEKPMDIRGLMTVADAAKELGVTKSRVIQLMDTYHVTAYRTGAQLLIPREQFNRIPKIRKPGRPMSQF